MKATCSKNPNHKRFITVAHVTEYWVVDERGNFVEQTGNTGEATHGPNPDNIWTCATCDGEVRIEAS